MPEKLELVNAQPYTHEVKAFVGGNSFDPLSRKHDLAHFFFSCVDWRGLKILITTFCGEQLFLVF